MNTTNATDTIDLIKQSRTILDDCAATLTQISTTCCMPERSVKMSSTFEILNLALRSLPKQAIQENSQQQDEARLHACIEHISNFGGKIGTLYVSCCTETREPLYQHILKQLNQAHTNMWVLLGHSH